MIEKDQKKKAFVARQPIFDCQKNIYGYELLFRHGLENFFDERMDKDYASSKVVLDSFMVFDFVDLTGGKRAFLNFTANVLLSEAVLTLPREAVIVELLETIEPTADVIEACQKLKDKGYMLALDDFVYDPRYRPLIDLADIIKVDFLTTTGQGRLRVMEQSGAGSIKYLAEKVESMEEYNEAVEMGYAYFQGYYFSKPVIVAGKDVPSYKINLLQIMKEMQQPEISVKRLEAVIGRDVSLSYKLLRFINSAAFGLVNEIQSIKHALNLLGVVEFKKWMSLMLLSQMGSDKPNELTINSLIRAKFCELMAQTLGSKEKQDNYFLMGLFSLIDAFLDRPMSVILNDLPISADIKTAILDKKGTMGRVLQLITFYEKSKWEKVSEISLELHIDEHEVLEHYFASIRWANNFGTVSS